MLRSPKLILVRHGATDWTEQERYDSFTETALSAVGKLQIERTAKHLANFGISEIITSPKQRAKQSAAIVSSTLGVKSTMDEELREIDFGLFHIGAPFLITP